MDGSARWRGTIGPDAWVSAFKPGHVPLCDIPGLGQAFRIAPDTMHCFHLGFGQDLCASSIVILASFGIFKNNGSFDAKLEAGYDSFMDFCHRKGKTTSVDLFCKQKFGMASRLWLCNKYSKFCVCHT